MFNVGVRTHVVRKGTVKLPNIYFVKWFRCMMRNVS